jgi:acyl carrier protein
MLDSADVVRLATHVERSLDISIPDRDITPEHFDSIARILDYVDARHES